MFNIHAEYEATVRPSLKLTLGSILGLFQPNSSSAEFLNYFLEFFCLYLACGTVYITIFSFSLLNLFFLWTKNKKIGRKNIKNAVCYRIKKNLILHP